MPKQYANQAFDERDEPPSFSTPFGLPLSRRPVAGFHVNQTVFSMSLPGACATARGTFRPLFSFFPLLPPVNGRICIPV